ncbi:hypothetical protein ABZW18_00355 [Streptomyces sp. NPDC004647]|uniref:hypothetical protein n=1 Tax=Streptomyces sp. NPDC004647 TaxID=3154671 RepID=UPI0033B32706
MQAESARRWVARAVVAALFSTGLVVAPPSAPEAHAAWSPCSLPGGATVCPLVKKGEDLVKKGADGVVKFSKDYTAVDEVGGAVNGAVDFASDPLGYIEQKLRTGTQGLFEAFGEELTGKNPGSLKGRDRGKQPKGKHQ